MVAPFTTTSVVAGRCAECGLDIEILRSIHLDVHVNYIFNAFSEIDGADEDSITLGAIARIALW